MHKIKELVTEFALWLTGSKTRFISILVLTFVSSIWLIGSSNPTDTHQNSVMIVNKGMTHGGTGIVINSTHKGSFVLTNDHVCKAIIEGGLVRTQNNNYQISKVLESKVSDLCLVYVASDLGQQTKLAAKEPEMYDKATVAGHPALLPNVLSTGHFSDRSIISVMTGIRECTAEDQNDPLNKLVCMIFNGMPVLKSYESVLVTATIMPGSSGSGVYNSKNELSGVVFAGSGDFGYAWTVPYDQVVEFLQHEIFKGQWQTLDQTVPLFGAKSNVKNWKETLKKCSERTEPVIVNLCDAIKKAVTWLK